MRGAAASSSRSAADARPAAYCSSASPPERISTMTSPASGWRSSTAPTIASTATTSVAHCPRRASSTVRQTIGAPVITRPTSQTVVGQRRRGQLQQQSNDDDHNARRGERTARRPQERR